MWNNSPFIVELYNRKVLLYYIIKQSGYFIKDSLVTDSLLSIAELTQIVQESNKRKNLPMINVRIYQDGTISPKSYALLKELNKRLSKKREKNI